MGLYATTTSFTTYLVGSNLDTATTSLISSCITIAENEVNKYVSERYDVSLWTASSDVPPLVRSWTEMYALGQYYQLSSRGSKESMARGREFKKDVLDNLKEIKDYKCNLVDTAGADIAEKTNDKYQIKSTSTDYTSTFDEGDPLKWQIDPDKLTDIEGAKT